MSLWYEQAKTRWRIRIKRSGQEIRKILPQGTTRAQAEALHTKLLREHFDIATLGRKPRYSISDALTRYIEEELPKLKSRRDSDIRMIADYCLGRPITEIPEAAAEYRAANPQLTAASRNRRAHVLRHVANLAYRWGWIDKPLYVPMEPETGARNTYLSPKQIKSLLAASGDPGAKAFLTIAAYTGMRRGEICGLTPQDVGREYITVQHSKTGRPRMVPIVGPVRAALKFVPFPHHRDTYSDIASKAGKAIGIEGFRLHDLRHTTASLLLNSGASLEVVGQVLGHMSVQTTRRYAHLAPDVAKAALEKAMGAK